MNARTPITPETWQQIRAGYMEGWPRTTFTALAEEHDVSRSAISRRAARERWAFHARVAHAAQRERCAADDLAFARSQAVELAQAIKRYATNKALSLEQLAAEAAEAHSAAWHVHYAAFQVAEATRDLADAKAGRPGQLGPALRDLTRPEHDAVGRWPGYGSRGPRKPFPWERRQAEKAVRS